MSAFVFFLLLAAALFHASWNIIVKSGANKLFEIGLNSLGGFVGAICILPFTEFPGLNCIPMLFISCITHLAYYFSMAVTYKLADLSVAYPVMRGSAPIFTALCLTLLGHPLPSNGWLAILLLCAGILSLSGEQFFSANRQFKGILFALFSAIIIMGYTIADGFGARLSQSSLSYTAWMYIINMIPLQLLILLKHKAAYLPYMKKRLLPGIFGGICGICSYGIALWAMTKTSIALVSALRETSVIFGIILAVIFLHERLGFLRLIAILLVTAGAISIRLA